MIIGIIGGIGSGKSTVAQEFHSFGVVVIDADQIAHTVLGLKKIIKKLTQIWGNDILDQSGQIHKQGLAHKAFKTPRSVHKLNAIIHPEIKKIMDTTRQKYKHDDIVIDAPLLIESGYHKSCDYVVYVQARFDVRAKRVKHKRHWSRAELKRRSALQMPLLQKRKYADVIIRNDSTRGEMRVRVRNVYNMLCSLSESASS